MFNETCLWSKSKVNDINTQYMPTHLLTTTKCLFVSYTTHKSMYQNIVKCSIVSETIYNFRHVYTSTFKYTVINAIVSTKSTYYAL